MSYQSNIKHHIFFVMGTTCSGKSTFLNLAQEKLLGEDVVGLVEVGKMMRAKYPPEHFAGQASPEHTRHEAWEMCESSVFELAGYGKRVILVDGQPRDAEQVHLCRSRFNFPEFETHYILIDAAFAIREHRARRDRSGSDLEALAIPRLENDMKTYFTVLVELLKHNERIQIFDTSCSMEEDLDSIEKNVSPIADYIKKVVGI